MSGKFNFEIEQQRFDEQRTGKDFFPVAPGMTMRDWFAGQALAGLLAKYGFGEAEPESMAADSYAYADAMLKAREVQP